MRSCAILLGLGLGAAAGAQAPVPRLPASALQPEAEAAVADATSVAAKPGKAHFWFAAYPDQIFRFDTETDEVVGRIKLRHGMPWSRTLTHDKQRFFIVTDQQSKVEVVDRREGAVTEVHEFSQKDYVIRVQSVTEIPGGKHWYVRIDRIKKLLDRFEFEPSQYLLYDPAAKKVEKKMRKLPKILDGRRRISPDGKTWFVTTKDGDIRIVDPETLKEVGKIDLTTPLYTGQGELRFLGDDLDAGSDPDHYRVLYTMSDPVQKRRSLWGIAKVSIQEGRLTDLQEFGASPGFWGYRVARDGKRAVASGSLGGGRSFGGGSGGGSSYDRKSRLVLFDLETGAKLQEAIVEFRPRQRLSAISPDGRKIYVGGAGSDFNVYDEHLQHTGVVELPGEIYGGIYVLDDPQ